MTGLLSANRFNMLPLDIYILPVIDMIGLGLFCNYATSRKGRSSYSRLEQELFP